MNTVLKNALHNYKKGHISHIIVECAGNHIPKLSHQLHHITENPTQIVDVTKQSSSAIRHLFINLVCTGRSVLATGLETLDEEALRTTLDGLASINQWNKQANGIGVTQRKIKYSLSPKIAYLPITR